MRKNTEEAGEGGKNDHFGNHDFFNPWRGWANHGSHVLGISIFVIHVLFVYVAWRTRIAGAIFLIGLTVVRIGFLVYNMILESLGFTSILLWLGFAACPLIGGLIFLRKRKKK
ncbi:MAG: hypothetical protein JSV17_11060 [Candidatus Aminicenantes bacterium]|nr:MAG: hypothetical protein JSV17_11060 [Candidatus Aminicenantes bacterium]